MSVLARWLRPAVASASIRPMLSLSVRSTCLSSSSAISSLRLFPYMQSSLILRARYHANVVDHYENPRNVGSLNSKDKDVGTGVVGAPACGDVMKIQVRVGTDGKIIETRFKTFGCGSAIASSSYATEWLEGKTVTDAGTIRNSDIAKHLNLPPVKMHCSMLAEDAIKAAIADYARKNPGSLAKATAAASVAATASSTAAKASASS